MNELIRAAKDPRTWVIFGVMYFVGDWERHHLSKLIYHLIAIGSGIIAVMYFVWCEFKVRRWRKIERRHGFPCHQCNAADFNDAADKCRGTGDCPGENMSREVFCE